MIESAIFISYSLACKVFDDPVDAGIDLGEKIKGYTHARRRTGQEHQTSQISSSLVAQSASRNHKSANAICLEGTAS